MAAVDYKHELYGDGIVPRWCGDIESLRKIGNGLFGKNKAVFDGVVDRCMKDDFGDSDGTLSYTEETDVAPEGMVHASNRIRGGIFNELMRICIKDEPVESMSLVARAEKGVERLTGRGCSHVAGKAVRDMFDDAVGKLDFDVAENSCGDSMVVPTTKCVKAVAALRWIGGYGNTEYGDDIASWPDRKLYIVSERCAEYVVRCISRAMAEVALRKRVYGADEPVCICSGVYAIGDTALMATLREIKPIVNKKAVIAAAFADTITNGRVGSGIDTVSVIYPASNISVMFDLSKPAPTVYAIESGATNVSAIPGMSRDEAIMTLVKNVKSIAREIPSWERVAGRLGI